MERPASPATLVSPGSPYRAAGASPPPPLAPLRLLYFPCAGVWPLLLSLIVGLPLAYWARHESRVPSTVTCSTLRVVKGERSCFAMDAGTGVAMAAVDCRETPEILERVLDARNPFSRPVVWATETQLPGMDTAAATGAGRECRSQRDSSSPFTRSATPTPAPTVTPSSPVTPAVPSFGAYEGDGLTVAEAEAKVQACAYSPDSSGPARTLTVVVLGRNYLRSALVLLGCLLAAAFWMLRRRTRVSIDAVRGRVRVEEYGLLARRRVSEVGAIDTAFVDIASGLAGPINGKRVELVGRGGARLPLVDLYAPLTTRVHEVTARKLREALQPHTTRRSPERPSVARRIVLAALVGMVAGGLIAGVAIFVRAHRGASPESWEGKKLTTTRSVDQGSTVVLARLGTTPLALVADKEKKMVRGVDAPVLVQHLGDPVADRIDGKLASAPGPMVLDRSGRLFVTLPQESAVAVLEVSPLGRSLQETARLPTEAEPVALALTADGATLVVLSNYGHALQTFEVGTLNPRLDVELSRSPRALALSADGKTAYVTHDGSSELSLVDLDQGKLTTQSLGTAKALPPTRHEERTVGTDRRGRHLEGVRYVYRSDTTLVPVVQAQVARAGDRLYLPSVVATISDPLQAPPTMYYGTAEKPAEQFSLKEWGGGGAVRDDSEGVFRNGVVVSGGKVTSIGEATAGLSNTSCLLPEATLVDEAHHWLYLTCDGPGQVYKIDIGTERRCFDEGAWGAGFHVGDDPTGMALDADDKVLVVWSQETQTLTTLPLDPAVPLGVPTWSQQGMGVRYDPAPEWLHPLQPSVHDAAASERARGRELFYATNDPEVSASGVACASCHIGGRDDGQTWPTANGPRQTPMLAARLDRTAPYGWTGRERDLHAYLQSTFERLGGKSLPRIDEDALVAYLRALPPPRFKVKDAASAERGRSIFLSAEAGCGSCHAPEQGVFTDTERHDVKSRVGIDSVSDFDTPSLLYIGGTAPYFHDGRYASLSALLRGVDGTMGHTAQLGDAQRQDLVAFLESLGATR
jgi:mono/diheme cytochrome c family protein